MTFLSLHPTNKDSELLNRVHQDILSICSDLLHSPYTTELRHTLKQRLTEAARKLVMSGHSEEVVRTAFLAMARVARLHHSDGVVTLYSALDL